MNKKKEKLMDAWREIAFVFLSQMFRRRRELNPALADAPRVDYAGASFEDRRRLTQEQRKLRAFQDYFLNEWSLGLLTPRKMVRNVLEGHLP